MKAKDAGCKERGCGCGEKEGWGRETLAGTRAAEGANLAALQLWLHGLPRGSLRERERDRMGWIGGGQDGVREREGRERK